MLAREASRSRELWGVVWPSINGHTQIIPGDGSKNVQVRIVAAVSWASADTQIIPGDGSKKVEVRIVAAVSGKD